MKVIFNVLNKLIPLKEKFVRGNQAPCTTKQLRKAIIRRSKFESKHLKNRTIDSKSKFKKQNIFSSKLYKKERKQFFSDVELIKTTDHKLFWKTIKLLPSDRCVQSSTISLVDNGNVISEDSEFAKKFSSYFEKTEIELGIKEYENFDMNPDSRSQDNVDIVINKDKNHPGIKMINENVSFKSRFNFKDISESDIQKEIFNLNSKSKCLVIYLQKYLKSLQMFLMQHLKIYRILKY